MSAILDCSRERRRSVRPFDRPGSGTRIVLVLLAAAAASAAASAQPTAQGSEFQVNTYTTGDQGKAAISANENGEFVAVWRSDFSLGDDTSSGSVQARRFGSSGSALGSDFQVNTYTPYNQSDPTAAVNPDGSFVVAWTSPEVPARLYDPAGDPLGDQFKVDGDSGASATQPAVSSAANGDFVVVYQDSYSSLDPDGYGILGQRFASNGSPIGAEFGINTFTTYDQRNPDVAMAPDGSFVVVWEHRDYGGGYPSDDSIRGRRYDSAGNALGSEFQVNTYDTGQQRYAAVDVDAGGNFVVAWQSTGSAGSDTNGKSIQARRWASDGSALGAEMQVNTVTSFDQSDPAVAVDPSGNFIVVWQSYGLPVPGFEAGPGVDDSGYSIHAREVAANGVPAGDEIQVNTYVTSDQSAPAIAYRGGGSFVVIWESAGSSLSDTSYAGILGQRLRATVIFVDDFESGGTSRWN